MAESEDKPQSPTGDDKGGGEKQFLDGTYHGQPVSWDEETARQLAQKGLDYETKMASVKADREAMASDKDEYGKFQQWRQALQSDPRRAEAVARAFQDPDSYVPAGGDQEVGDDPPPARRPAPPPGTDPALLQLKGQIEQLQTQLKGVSEASAADTQKVRLERAVDTFGFLSSDNEKGLAIETAEGLMARNPDMTPEGALAVAAEKLKGVLQGQNQSKLDRKGAAEDMRTVDPKDGTPMGASDKGKPPPDYTRRRHSTLRADVMKEMVNGAFRDRFKNF